MRADFRNVAPPAAPAGDAAAEQEPHGAAVRVLTRLGFLVVCGVGLVNFVVSARAQRWAETTATLTASDLRSERTGSSHWRNVLHVRYAYRVSGVSYEGTRVNLSRNSAGTLESTAQRLAAQYRVGARVTVYYDPDAPADAVLDRRLHWNHWLGLVLGLVGIPLTLRNLASLRHGLSFTRQSDAIRPLRLRR